MVAVLVTVEDQSKTTSIETVSVMSETVFVTVAETVPGLPELSAQYSSVSVPGVPLRLINNCALSAAVLLPAVNERDRYLAILLAELFPYNFHHAATLALLGKSSSASARDQKRHCGAGIRRLEDVDHTAMLSAKPVGSSWYLVMPLPPIQLRCSIEIREAGGERGNSCKLRGPP